MCGGRPGAAAGWTSGRGKPRSASPRTPHPRARADLLAGPAGDPGRGNAAAAFLGETSTGNSGESPRSRWPGPAGTVARTPHRTPSRRPSTRYYPPSHRPGSPPSTPAEQDQNRPAQRRHTAFARPTAVCPAQPPKLRLMCDHQLRNPGRGYPPPAGCSGVDDGWSSPGRGRVLRCVQGFVDDGSRRYGPLRTDCRRHRAAPAPLA
jgi:hypothetical protein